MERRILLCSLVASVLTLAFVFWYDGLRYDAVPATRAAPQPNKGSLVPTSAAASNPFAPTGAAAPPATAIAPPEPVQSEPQTEPYSTPDVDEGARLARGNRGAARGPRSR